MCDAYPHPFLTSPRLNLRPWLQVLCVDYLQIRIAFVTGARPHDYPHLVSRNQSLRPGAAVNATLQSPPLKRASLSLRLGPRRRPRTKSSITYANASSHVRRNRSVE